MFRIVNRSLSVGKGLKIVRKVPGGAIRKRAFFGCFFFPRDSGWRPASVKLFIASIWGVFLALPSPPQRFGKVPVIL